MEVFSEAFVIKCDGPGPRSYYGLLWFDDRTRGNTPAVHQKQWA